ncbi:hypothetical protein CHELA1G11_13236 [Hyphomicrobiales bacterium]|nr:hypothetical protein CHELA1G2_11075 [Hyphomicrobiales bacterium]CAH1670255.1 hypothetical protein CHELA1G11_13236 [Hyphomicrobiales bacterium]
MNLSGVEMARLAALYIAVNTAKDVFVVHCATSSGAVEDILEFEVQRLGYVMKTMKAEASSRLPNDLTERRFRTDIIA